MQFPCQLSCLIVPHKEVGHRRLKIGFESGNSDNDSTMTPNQWTWIWLYYRKRSRSENTENAHAHKGLLVRVKNNLRFTLLPLILSSFQVVIFHATRNASSKSIVVSYTDSTVITLFNRSCLTRKTIRKKKSTVHESTEFRCISGGNYCLNVRLWRHKELKFLEF